MFGSDNYGIEHHIVTIAKGLTRSNAAEGSSLFLGRDLAAAYLPLEVVVDRGDGPLQALFAEVVQQHLIPSLRKDMRDTIPHLTGAYYAYGLDHHVGSPTQTELRTCTFQAPLPSTGEAASRTRGLREKLIGVRSPGMPSGEMQATGLTCGSSSASATVLIGPPAPRPVREQRSARPSSG